MVQIRTCPGFYDLLCTMTDRISLDHTRSLNRINDNDVWVSARRLAQAEVQVGLNFKETFSFFISIFLLLLYMTSNSSVWEFNMNQIFKKETHGVT